MNTKNTKKLYKDFPKLYAHRKLPITQSLMGFGFECGNGWYKLIHELSYCIQWYIDHNKHLKISQVRVTKVKEKFGGLRFYIDGGNRTIHGMIWFAQSISYRICEECGSMDDVQRIKSGWISSLCKKCRRVYEKSKS